MILIGFIGAIKFYRNISSIRADMMALLTKFSEEKKPRMASSLNINESLFELQKCWPLSTTISTIRPYLP